MNLDYLLVAACTAYSSSEKKCKMYFSKAVSVVFFCNAPKISLIQTSVSWSLGNDRESKDQVVSSCFSHLLLFWRK